MFLLIRALILSYQGPILMKLFNLNYLLIGSSPNRVTLGIKASTYEFRSVTIQSIALIKELWGHLSLQEEKRLPPEASRGLLKSAL